MSQASSARVGRSRGRRFWGVVIYELLWNLRKKKLIGMVIIAFALATLSLALPTLLGGLTGESSVRNPQYVIEGASIGGLGFFLFGLVTAMNSMSSEFEGGTIIPLLTKPVSRTVIFLGKLTGAFLTLVPVYVLLFIYQVIGGTLVYGPQSDLNLVVFVLLGSLLSTTVWIAIVFALGSISRSTLLTALVAFGVFVGLSIVGTTVASFSGQQWVLTYLPGSGATGYTNLTATTSINVTQQGINGTSGATGLGISVSSGTDSIGATLATLVLHPSASVTFFRQVIQIGASGVTTTMVPTYTEPLWFVAAEAILIAAAYVFAFCVLSWFFFRRAEVTE